MPLSTFKTASEFKEAVDSYFKKQIKEKRPFTVAGLALHCGCCVDTLLNTAKKCKDKGFDEVARYAMLRIQEAFETEMADGSRRNVTGIIFMAKNHFGMADKQDVNNTHTFTQMPTIKKGQAELSFDVGKPIKKEK